MTPQNRIGIYGVLLGACCASTIHTLLRDVNTAAITLAICGVCAVVALVLR